MTRATNWPSANPWSWVLAAALAAAGGMHCLLTPEHLAMSPIFGAGFLVAGVGQLGMAGLVVARPSRLLYAAVLGSTVVLSSMYAYNVLIGLPFREDPTAAAASDKRADGHSDEADSAEAAHSEEADHSESGGHSDDAHPSGDASSSGGHDDGDDHEELAEADHHEDGLVIGGGEPVDAYGAVTQLAQLSAAAIAAVLLARSRRLTA